MKSDSASCNSAQELEKTRKTAMEYEEEASKLCNFSYMQKEEAEKLLKNAVRIIDAHDITGYKPVSKKGYYNSGELSYEIFSNCASTKSDGTNMGVNYIYDTVLRKYDKSGLIKKEIAFSRVLNQDECNYTLVRKLTDKPFVKYIKEYDAAGRLERKIEGNHKNTSQPESIALYDGNRNKKLSINFENNRLVNCAKGDFVQNNGLLRCPLIYEFNNDELIWVKKNLTYYGFNVINCETFNFEDGKFSVYEKCEHTLHG